MTLIQIIPINPRATKISFLVDVLALDTSQPKTALDPLKRVLEDFSITKVLYDCRNDAGALWREQQCRLQGVLDLQLLDLLVWEDSASEQQRLLRLKGYMKSNTEKFPFFYKNVYQLSGLRAALIKNKVDLSPQLQAHLTVKKSKPPGWYEAWLHRPLDPQLLEYAVYDVASILALYQHFLAAGWVDRFDGEVRAGSNVYASMYIKVPYRRGNPFQNHPLLPFNVLNRLSPNGSGQRKLCIGCERRLQKQCFNKEKQLCYVCGCIDNRIRRGLK